MNRGSREPIFISGVPTFGTIFKRVRITDGNDTIEGDSGDDIMIGGGGLDSLMGGADDDIIIGDGGLILYSGLLSDAGGLVVLSNPPDFTPASDAR